MTKDEKKVQLLEVAENGHGNGTKSETVAQAVADLIAARAAAKEAKADEEAARQVLEEHMIRHNLNRISCDDGTVSISVKTRKGLDKGKIPKEILEAAETLTPYVQMDAR